MIAVVLRVVTAARIGMPDTEAWGIHFGAAVNGIAVANVKVQLIGEPDPTVIVPIRLVDALVTDGLVPHADSVGLLP